MSTAYANDRLVNTASAIISDSIVEGVFTGYALSGKYYVNVDFRNCKVRPGCRLSFMGCRFIDCEFNNLEGSWRFDSCTFIKTVFNLLPTTRPRITIANSSITDSTIRINPILGNINPILGNTNSKLAVKRFSNYLRNIVSDARNKLHNFDLRISSTRVDLPECHKEQLCKLPAGDIIGWKACRSSTGARVLVKLLVPTNALRLSGYDRKCRASKAKVLGIYKRGSNRPLGPNSVAYSMHDHDFKYAVGNWVRPTRPFNKDMFSVCSSGIHFFITRGEAERY